MDEKLKFWDFQGVTFLSKWGQIRNSEKTQRVRVWFKDNIWSEPPSISISALTLFGGVTSDSSGFQRGPQEVWVLVTQARDALKEETRNTRKYVIVDTENYRQSPGIIFLHSLLHKWVRNLFHLSNSMLMDNCGIRWPSGSPEQKSPRPLIGRHVTITPSDWRTA